MPPAEAQEMALPLVSVIVTMVLLKEELICTAPRSMFFRSLRRVRTFFLGAAITYPSLTSSYWLSCASGPCGYGRWSCCAGRGRAGPSCGAGRGRADLGQALDVQRHAAAEVAFHDVVVVYALTDLGLFLVGEILTRGVGVDTSLSRILFRAGSADTVDIGEADLYPLVLWAGQRRLYVPSFAIIPFNDFPAPFRRRLGPAGGNLRSRGGDGCRCRLDMGVSEGLSPDAACASGSRRSP